MNAEPGADSGEDSGKFATIAVLESEIEAQVLDAVLIDRKIPHVVMGHFDSVYGGIFQGTGGWGHVAAPQEYRADIEAILEEIRSQTPELPDDSAGGEPPSAG